METTWDIYLAAAKDDSSGFDDRSRIPTRALDGVLRRLLTNSYRGFDNADKWLGRQDKDPSVRRCLIVPAWCRVAIARLFKETLSFAYGKSDANIRLQRSWPNYFFLDHGKSDIRFQALQRTMSGAGLGTRSHFEAFLCELCAYLVTDAPGEASSTTEMKGSLRHIIEGECFPSGAAEMQEILFRDRTHVHTLLGPLAPQRTAATSSPRDRRGAARLIVGALAAGDISLSQAVGALKQLRPRDDDWTAVCDRWHRTLSDTDNAQSIERVRQELGISPSQHLRLADYMLGHHDRVLIVEDRYEIDGWDVALPAVLGAPARGAGAIKHVPSARNVDPRPYWVILLDLSSSAARHRDNLVLATVGQDVEELCRNVLKIQSEGSSENRYVPVSSPRVVVFSGDATGATTRTMLRQLRTSDYFFKAPDGEAHKSEFYSTFRNAIVSALEEDLQHVVAATVGAGERMARHWLMQFDPVDRPIVLGIMKHFRYYSALSIVELFDRFLTTEIGMPGPGLRVSLFTKHVPVRRGFQGTEVSANNLVFSYIGRPNKSAPSALALLAKSEWMRRFRSDPAIAPTRIPTFSTYDELVGLLLKRLGGEVGETPTDSFCVVLVDDVIGSGGQVQDYAFKLFYGRVWELLAKRTPDKAEQLWCSLRDRLQNGYITIYCLFAIGIENSELSLLVERSNADTSDCQTVSPAFGRFNLCCKDYVPVRALFERKTAEAAARGTEYYLQKDDVALIPGGVDVPVYLAVAEYNRNVFDVCSAEGISPEKLGEVLMKYRYSAEGRKSEYPCQFEPWGWKRSGGLLSTYANCPGNTLPIVWGARRSDNPWEPLFPRIFNPWDKGNPKGGNQCEGATRKCVLVPETRVESEQPRGTRCSKQTV